MLEMERNLYVVLITSLALGGEKNDLKQKALGIYLYFLHRLLYNFVKYSINIYTYH